MDDPPKQESDEPLKIYVRDFSTNPGPSKESYGPFSGELFRREVFEPALKEAIKNKRRLIVDLDGTAGYASCWLEEVFCGAIENGINTQEMLSCLDLVSVEEPLLIDEINGHISCFILKGGYV